MALRYSYDVKQGGWVLDNHGLFQTPYRIAQYYGQDVYGFKMGQDLDGLVDLGSVNGNGIPGHPGALVLGYGRDDKNQCFIDPNATRNPYESDGCPPPKIIPRKGAPRSVLALPKPPKNKHATRDMVALLVVFLLVIITIFAFQGFVEK